jgi:predicted nucleic acid-binding Zn ribbon protein
VTHRDRLRPAGEALRNVVAETAPATLLAAVQRAWPEVVGARVAAQADPIGERDGTVTVACRSATWAQELDLMQDQIRERLNAALAGHQVSALRFTADADRHRS